MPTDQSKIVTAADYFGWMHQEAQEVIEAFAKLKQAAMIRSVPEATAAAKSMFMESMDLAGLLVHFNNMPSLDAMAVSGLRRAMHAACVGRAMEKRKLDGPSGELFSAIVQIALPEIYRR